MNFVKTISSRIVESVRLVKFQRKGKDDIRECKSISPHGVDSHPIEDLIAVYSETDQNGKNVILGYINRNAIADVGELRLYATNVDGDEQNYIYLKNDGQIEIGGNGDNLIRYSPLNSELTAFKNQIQVELGLIATAIAGVGGAYAPGTLTIDISASKIDEVECS